MLQPRKRRRAAPSLLAAAIVVGVCFGCFFAVARAQRAPVLESVSTYDQCTTDGGDDGPPDLAGLNCTADTGFVSVIVNLQPSSGGGDVFQFRTQDAQFQSAAPRNELFEDIAVQLQVSALDVYYRLDLERFIPTQYAVQQVLQTSCPCCGACTGNAVALSSCLGASNGFPEFPTAALRYTPPLRVALVNETEMFRGLSADSRCFAMHCGVCINEAGAAPSRRSCQYERWAWVYPLWRVYRVQPYPVVSYTVTATLTRAQDGATQQLVLRAFGVPNGTESEYVAFSADGRVRLELLDQSQFDTIPAQLGLIVAAERHPLATPSPGNAIVPCNPAVEYCPPYNAYEEGDENPRVARAGSVAPVPEWWFWGTNYENQLRIGPNCNEYGVTPDYIQRGGTRHVDAPYVSAADQGVPTDAYPNEANVESMCHSFQTTCVPGRDFWSALGEFAQSPMFFTQQNAAFCAADAATRRCTRTGVPPFMPQPSTSNNGVPNVHLRGDRLQVSLGNNLGFTLRVQMRVDGSFLRRVRVLGSGYLRHIERNACVLTLGGSGNDVMQVDVCSSSPAAADFTVALNCSAAGADYVVNVAEATLTVPARQCVTASLRLRLQGSTIVPEGRSCVLRLFDSNTTLPRLLDTLTEGCREQLPDVVPPATSTGGSGGNAPPSVACDWYNVWCFADLAVPNWLAMLLLALIPLLILLAIIGCAIACGGPLVSLAAKSTLG